MNEEKELDEIIDEKVETVNSSLSKFENLPKLFEDASDLIEKYFDRQTKYKNLDDFKDNLTILLNLYASTFSMTTEEYDKYFDYLNIIEGRYHELLYFGEDHNPIEYSQNLNKKNVVNILSQKK